MRTYVKIQAGWLLQAGWLAGCRGVVGGACCIMYVLALLLAVLALARSSETEVENTCETPSTTDSAELIRANGIADLELVASGVRRKNLFVTELDIYKA